MLRIEAELLCYIQGVDSADHGLELQGTWRDNGVFLSARASSRGPRDGDEEKMVFERRGLLRHTTSPGGATGRPSVVALGSSS